MDALKHMLLGKYVGSRVQASIVFGLSSIGSLGYGEFSVGSRIIF